MGQRKTKTLQASLIDFCFFLPIPAGWDHPCQSVTSVVTFFPTAPRPLFAHKQACMWFLKNSAPFSSQMTSIRRSKPFFDMARSALSRVARAARKRWVFRIPCKPACEVIGKTQRQLGSPKHSLAEYPCLSVTSVVKKPI